MGRIDILKPNEVQAVLRAGFFSEDDYLRPNTAAPGEIPDYEDLCPIAALCVERGVDCWYCHETEGEGWKRKEWHFEPPGQVEHQAQLDVLGFAGLLNLSEYFSLVEEGEDPFGEVRDLYDENGKRKAS